MEAYEEEDEGEVGAAGCSSIGAVQVLEVSPGFFSEDISDKFIFTNRLGTDLG